MISYRLIGLGLVVLLIAGLTCHGNQAPYVPDRPSGPTSGEFRTPYAFVTTALDPERGRVRYQFDWGDGSQEWTDYNLPGGSGRLAHSWNRAGSYEVRARAQDEKGDTSGWSEGTAVSIIGYPWRVIATVPVGPNPRGIAVLPNGDYVYVTNEYTDSVHVIRTSDNEVVGQIVLGPGGLSPMGITALPNGQYAYVASWASGCVSVIRTSDNTVVATIPSGGCPWGITSSPSGDRVYVTNQGSDDVSVIRTSDNTVVARIPLTGFGWQPVDVAVVPSGDYAYVANIGFSVAVLRTTDNSFLTEVRIPGVGGFWSVTALPGGEFVCASGGGRVFMIRTSDNTVTDSVQYPHSVSAIAASPDGNYLYAASYFDSEVSVLRLSDRTIVATIRVRDLPSDVSVSPAGDRVYVANKGDGTVSVLGF